LPLLKKIPDKRIQKLIIKRGEKLSSYPELQGKPLKDDLVGLRSVRVIGQRYRIIYEIDNVNKEVLYDKHF